MMFHITSAIGGYWYGSSKSYDKGYQAAVADVKGQAGGLYPARRPEEAAKAANPFQMQQPAGRSEANPFVRPNALNPFAK